MAISHKNIPESERHNPKGFDGASGGTVLKKVNTSDAAPTWDAVRNTDFKDGELGAEKLQTGTAERGWVLARTASASFGGVGTYAFLRIRTSTAYAAGSSIPGSSLTAGGLFAEGGFNTSGGSITGASITSNGAALSGTWQAMGTLDYADGSVQDRFTLFLRIA